MQIKDIESKTIRVLEEFHEEFPLKRGGLAYVMSTKDTGNDVTEVFISLKD